MELGVAATVFASRESKTKLRDAVRARVEKSSEPTMQLTIIEP
jgi:hypothetical protein